MTTKMIPSQGGKKSKFVAHATKKTSPSAVYELHSDAVRLPECLEDILKRLDVKSVDDLVSLKVEELRPDGVYRRVHTLGDSEVVHLPTRTRRGDGAKEFFKYRVELWKTADQKEPVVHSLEARSSWNAANSVAAMYSINGVESAYACRVYAVGIGDGAIPVFTSGAKVSSTVVERVELKEKYVLAKRYSIEKG